MSETDMSDEEKLNAALLKVALGCKVAEVTEEYAEIDGELKLTKRKKTRKDIPPDLKAVQMLLGESGLMETEKMTDEELERERLRLLALLKTGQEGQSVVKKTVPKSKKKKEKE
ncbi:MAG: hypothetical protein IJV80_04120 [Clostridia bacterium]|nr:hypothetical protein [Clostridia bacterium]